MLIHVCFLSYCLFLEMTAIEKALFFLFCSRKKAIYLGELIMPDLGQMCHDVALMACKIMTKDKGESEKLAQKLLIIK